MFKAFEPFERYGFNKAHATCYGLIAYQTAYLKANYTVEYMTAVLTAFRDNAEKVAAAVAECRRLGIEVRPPDVHRSGLEFTVEGDAIRFGLLAVKNVGEGAIESIIAARESGGEFRSLTDFCSRVDLRLANRKVLESLAKVGALNAFGHPAQLLLGLDDALASGAGDPARPDHRPDVAVRHGGDGRGDPRAAAAADARGPGPRAAALGEGAAGPVPVRSPDGRGRRAGGAVRDRILGRPQGRVARRPAGGRGRDRHRVADRDHEVEVDDGRGDRSRTCRAPSRSSSSRGPTSRRSANWREGAILLVAGRVDHRGEEASLLADAVWDWDTVADRGAEAFAREVGALDRRGGGRRGGPGGPGGYRNGNGDGGRRDAVAVGPGLGAAVAAGSGGESPLRVSPTREADDDLPQIAPAEPIPTYAEPPDLASASLAGGVAEAEEPPLPDELRNLAAAAAQAPSEPVDASPGAVLNVRFARDAGSERVVTAMQAFKAVLRERPGATRVVVHVPAPGGSALPMELRGVAYDAELLAEMRRRVGDGVIELSLG